MTRLRPAFLLLLLSAVTAPLAGAAAAAEFTPESRVVEVTVYRQAALVTREALLTLPPGSHRIILNGLPSVADPDSVHVSGTGSSGIEIGGVEVQQEFRQPDLTPEYRQVERDLDDLNRQMSLLNDRRQSIATLREFMGGLKSTGGQESSRDVLTKGFAVESWQKAFDFFSAHLNALSEEERVLETKQRDLGQRLEVARGRKSQITSQGGIRRWTAAVLVAASRGGDLTLRVSYLATGATWQPLYDARLDPATERVSLSWQAQVFQTTGEDWKDVAITLATTRPSAGIDLPVLASLDLTLLERIATSQTTFNSEYINGLPILGRNYQDVLTLGSGVSDADGDGNPGVMGNRDIEVRTAGASAGYGAVQVALASVARREVAVTFVLPGRMDIPSDGQPHKHLIATRDMQAKIEHRAVPQIVPAVFLVATVTLPGEVPLLPGKVQHFVGGDLVGGSVMTARAAGEEFALSFGPDDRLKAERKQLQKRVDRRGRDDEVAYRFVTTLENHLGRDGVVEVKDRIPISGDERVQIALDDDATTPGAATNPNEPGILTWKVQVPKDGKKEIALSYRVRSPRGVVVAGLD
jgi:hypothetical protein